MENAKLIKTAKTLDTLVKVAAGFMRAFAIVCAVFAVLVLILGEKMFEVGSLSLDVGFVKLALAQEYQVVTASLKAYAIIALCMSGVVCAAIARALGYLRAILSPMKEGRPFEESVPLNLRKIAWITLCSGALMQFVAIVEQLILTKAYPMEQIFSSAAIAGVEYTYVADFSFVWMFVVMMFLSYVFAYGQKLQRESDETL